MPSTNQSIKINTPIGDVWNRVKDFHDFSWAPNVITRVEKVGSVDGSSVGAKRILNGVFHETLIEINDAEHSLRYSIDDGPSPVSKDDVSNYVGSVKLSADNAGGTLVEWTSSWDSKEEDAVEFCHGIYVALLSELEKSFS
jgi:hypothetical protein